MARMSKRMGHGVDDGQNAEDEGAEVAAREDASEADTAPVDLKATVTLSEQALADLLEEVKHSRTKTASAVPALPDEPMTPLPQGPVAPSPRHVASKADSKPLGKADGGKAEPSSEQRSWWTRGRGLPAKR